MESLALQAGRELDALISEKVMGWDRVSDSFRPSTDMRSAWLVVEKLSLFETQYLTGSDKYGWSIVTVEGDGYEMGGWATHTIAHAPTAPLAICLAALKVVTSP